MFRKVMRITPRVEILEPGAPGVALREKVQLAEEIIGDGIRHLYEESVLHFQTGKPPESVALLARKLLKTCGYLERVNACNSEPALDFEPVPRAEIAALRSCIMDFIPGERPDSPQRRMHIIVGFYNPPDPAVDIDMTVDLEGVRRQNKRLRYETVPGLCRAFSARAIDLQGAHLLLNHTAEIVVTGVSQHKWVDRFHYYVAARMVAPDVSGMDFLGAVSDLDLFPYMVIPAHENRLFY